MVRLQGKQRDYQALILYRSRSGEQWVTYETEQERMVGLSQVEILDNITSEINTVLKDESPRVRSPWNKYINTSLYTAVTRTIAQAKKAGSPLIPSNAPIGYLPGDDVTASKQDVRTLSTDATCPRPPTVVISGPSTVPLAGSAGILTPAPINTIQLIGTGDPPGGSFGWSTSSSHVSLNNTTSDTVTVTSISESGTPNDVPIVLVYAVDGQGNSATKEITVQKPTFMAAQSIDSSGPRSCANDPQSGLPEAGWTKVITFQLQDKWNQPIGSVPSYDAWAGGSPDSCFLSYEGTPPGGAVGSTGLWQHEFGICSTACPNGGACTTNATWNFFANGWQIGSPVIFHCNSITVDGN